MRWVKKGLICSHETFHLPWYMKNTMVPVPYLIEAGRLRVFITMCDEKNIGRIGYVDVNPKNPSEILGYSKTPVVDIGDDGCFDDNGVVTASLMKEGDRLYLYYSGYQSCVKVPYLIFAGVAVSKDNGHTFTKLSSRVPLLDRVDGEVATRCAPFVMKDGDVYKIWYTSDTGSGWVSGEKKKLPLYDLKYATSDSPTEWPRHKGNTVVPLKDRDEHGIAKCTLWKEDGLYKIIYSNSKPVERLSAWLRGIDRWHPLPPARRSGRH